MNPVIVKHCAIGTGKPKIIVPIVAQTRADILAEASTFHSIPVDVVEWRIDWYESVFDTNQLIETAKLLQAELKEIPLLITFRTAKEGGERDVNPTVYGDLLAEVCRANAADLIDIELFIGDEVFTRLVSVAHENGVKVIASNHEWTDTPSEEVILSRLRRMRELGADIPKLAVTPTCNRDVITLLSATEEMSRTADCPIITMSMRGTGVISRLVGESMGSAMTFGCASKASAPGQVGVVELNSVLDTIHNALG